MSLPLNKMPFEFAVVEFNLKAISPIFFDKYPGFIIRSGFGAALKKLCIYRSHRVPCTECRIQDSCPYSYIFETYRPGDRDIDFTAENFPHPFVFVPDVKDVGLVHSGSTLTITLTLFGKGIDYLLFYVYAFDLLGDMGLGRGRGRYILQSVTDRFSGNTLYSRHDKTLRGRPVRKSLEDMSNSANCDSLALDFVYPTKIEERNRTVEKLTADILIRSLLRRASLLAERHHEQKWHIDFRGIIDQFNANISSMQSDLKLDRMERYSVRQRRSQPLFAFTGACVLQGELGPYLPLFSLGSYMHVGKSTSQGFGKYDLEIPNIKNPNEQCSKCLEFGF